MWFIAFKLILGVKKICGSKQSPLDNLQVIQLVESRNSNSLAFLFEVFLYHVRF